jgi:hypothetical protein
VALLHRAPAALMAFGILVAVPTITLADGPPDRTAYEAATKCFVVNGLAARSRTKAGDKATAAQYDAQAHQSFDTALQLGRSIGLSGEQMSRDIDRTQAQELPKMMSVSGYYRDAMATCKAYGLM